LVSNKVALPTCMGGFLGSYNRYKPYSAGTTLPFWMVANVSSTNALSSSGIEAISSLSIDIHTAGEHPLFKKFEHRIKQLQISNAASRNTGPVSFPKEIRNGFKCYRLKAS
jgi:hypothetical protein